jgi:hypothetical protein
MGEWPAGDNLPVSFRRNSLLKHGGRNLLLPGSSAPTNRALDREVRRGAPMRTLHEYGILRRSHPGSCIAPVQHPWPSQPTLTATIT